MAASPRGALSGDDLSQLTPEARRRLLERNPQLREALEPEAPPPPASTPAAPAPTKPAAAPAPARGSAGRPGKAAPEGSKDRTSAKRPTAASRRPASGRRLAKRVARETPGIPGPSATNLVLSFFGTTVLVMGLVLLVSNGGQLAPLPGALRTLTDRLLAPDDPIF